MQFWVAWRQKFLLIFKKNNLYKNEIIFTLKSFFFFWKYKQNWKRKFGSYMHATISILTHWSPVWLLWGQEQFPHQSTQNSVLPHISVGNSEQTNPVPLLICCISLPHFQLSNKSNTCTLFYPLILIVTRHLIGWKI